VKANEIAANLAALSRDLVELLSEYQTLNEAKARADAAFKVGYARAYMAAEGTLDARKHAATIATADLLFGAELAEVQFDNCRTALRVLGQRLDAGRTLASTVRAEAIATGTGMP
jgi:hypothetical protein